VSNCLRFIAGDTDYILIHDGVRPFIDGDTIRRAVSAARKTGACLVGVPLIPTVKKVDGNLEIVSTPPRDRLWVAQTPQVFKKEIILKAYKLAHGFAERRAGRRRNVPTDDAMLVERLGKRVKIVRGSYRNIKITTPEDLKLAEVLK